MSNAPVQLIITAPASLSPSYICFYGSECETAFTPCWGVAGVPDEATSTTQPNKRSEKVESCSAPNPYSVTMIRSTVAVQSEVLMGWS